MFVASDMKKPPAQLALIVTNRTRSSKIVFGVDACVWSSAGAANPSATLSRFCIKDIRPSCLCVCVCGRSEVSRAVRQPISPVTVCRMWRRRCRGRRGRRGAPPAVRWRPPSTRWRPSSRRRRAQSDHLLSAPKSLRSSTAETARAERENWRDRDRDRERARARTREKETNSIVIHASIVPGSVG